MAPKIQHDHQVASVKSFPPWKPGMKAKRRVKVLDEDGAVSYEIKQVPIPADKRSQMNHLHMSNAVQRHWMVLWGQADKCPLFRQKIVRKPNADGATVAYKKDANHKDITTRANRVLSGHTLKTLASGAVATVNAQLHADSKTLRLDLRAEDAKYPMLPTFSVGASYAVEAAFTAYVQEIFATAVEIQKAHPKKHSKVTAKCCQAAAEIVNRKLASATGFVPTSVAFRKPIKKKRSKEDAASGAKAAVVEA